MVISRYVKANSEDAADTFNHFSLLKTIEDLFSVPQLGYAKDTSLPEFDTVVFNNFTAGLSPPALARLQTADTPWFTKYSPARPQPTDRIPRRMGSSVSQRIRR